MREDKNLLIEHLLNCNNSVLYESQLNEIKRDTSKTRKNINKMQYIEFLVISLIRKTNILQILKRYQINNYGGILTQFLY